MKKYRIQLASNYQVVELTVDDLKELDPQELSNAIELVNKLGASVANDVINKPKATGDKVDAKVELATENQIHTLVKLGIEEVVARGMTKKSAWKYISENM